MLHEEKVIIAQHRIPDETTETTQVKELLEPVDLDGAVVTADAAHAQRETAEYIAGPEEDGEPRRGLLPVRRACFTLLLLLVMACQRVQPGRVRPGYGALCGVRG